MFERYTDRARKVVQIARQESAKQGDSSVGTDHLLYGLLAEGTGVAANVLDSCGLSKPKFRELSIELSLTQEARHSIESGPDFVANIIQGGHTLTRDAYRTLGEGAAAAARSLNHNYVGTEHVLLALAEIDEDGRTPPLALCILRKMDITPTKIRNIVFDLLGVERRLDPGTVVFTTVEQLDTEIARLHAVNARHKRGFRLKDRSPLRAAIHFVSEASELLDEFAAEEEGQSERRIEEAADVLNLFLSLMKFGNLKLSDIIVQSQKTLVNTFTE